MRLITTFFLVLLKFVEATRFARFCRSTIAGIGIAIAPIFVANSQIPMTDEFYVTSGTKVRDPKTVVVLKPIETLDVSQMKGSNMKRVEGLKGLISTARWEDLRAELKYYKPIYSRYLGYKSLDELADAQGLEKKAAENLESIRDETAFELKQLDDVAISSRALFFNKEDLKQVEGMYLEEASKQREDANIAEAMDIYDSIADSFKSLIACF